jgi:hypothetical protein
VIILMNQLPIAKRVKVLQMLCEGVSLRAISRMVDVSINTVTKLLVDAGEACLTFHDAAVQNVKAKRVQCHLCQAKERRESENRSGWCWRYVDLDRD